MRLDAKKFIKYYRRPVPQRVTDIGVWYPILGIVGRIAVASNAFIIAFSSHFIPKLVYEIERQKNNTQVDSFLEHSLAYFNVTDFHSDSAPIHTDFANVKECR